MTSEEAIKILEDWDGYFIGHGSDDVNDALAIAIKSIKDWTVRTHCLPKRNLFGTWRHFEKTITCSVCGTNYCDNIIDYCGDDVPHFCPNCGSEMIDDCQ